MNKTPHDHLRLADPVIGQLIDRFGPVIIPSRRVAPFQSLIHAIAHQQLTGKAANTILRNFQGLWGNGKFPSADQILEIDIEKIRSAGFSKSKATYIQGVAENALTGFIPSLRQCDKMTNAEILERLTTLRG